ncbi:phage tail spike protein [Clostridium perfringens]|uniref:phage tail spike protein n=1 Tax=Clostridium perfringens TaxID=1502 RepID=UPI001A7E4EA7|nr:phage tail spike protein [Clostridium perfringens]
MIQLYKPNNKNYYMNGDMILKPIEAAIRMELNGLWEVNLVHPFDKKGRWRSIEINDVIKVDLPWGEDLYYIYDLDDSSDEGIIINCKHIFFKLNKTYCKNVNDTKNLYDVRPTNCSAEVALNTVFAGTNFRGESNITDTNTSYFIRKSILEAVVGNDDNSILNRWGGELFLNNYTVTLNHRIGEDHGVKCKYGNNSMSFKRNRNSEDIITRAIIVMYDGLMLPEQYVDSPLINNYPEIYEGIVEFKDIKVKENPEDEDGFDTKEEAFEEARRRIKEVFKNDHIDLPKITFEVDMINKSNSLKGIVKEGYIVNLGDTVTAEHEALGIYVKTRAIAIEMDLLTQKYISITLSNESLERSSLVDSVNTLDKITTTNGGVKANSIEGIINAMQTKFKALRDVAQPQHTLGMLFEDKIKGSETYGAMAIGSMGFMIASERTLDDKDWNWKTFGSGQGFFADWLVGKLMTVLITNLDRSFEIDLNKPGGALFRNNGKDAILIENNMIKLFNWKKNGDYIGALMSLVYGDDENKPLIGLANDVDSALSLGYALKDSKDNRSYIHFDKHNTLEDDFGKPIRVWEDTDYKGHKIFNVVLSSNNEENWIVVKDDELSLKYKDQFLMITDKGITLKGDIILDGVIKNTSGNTVFDPNAPIGGGADGDWQNGVMSSNQFRMLKGYEGLGRYEYRDSGGVLTIGYGITKSEPDVYNRLLANQPVPEEMAAKEMFNVNNNRYGKSIVSKVKALGCTTQQQFDALVDLAFNAGTGVIGANNSLMNAIRRNPTDEAYIRPIWENFYIHDDAGNRLEGLRLRRIAEANIYFQGRYEKRAIPILGRNGKPTGSVVTENNGDGWLPPRIDSTGNFKTVNNDYGNGWIIPVTGGQVTATFPSYSSGAPHSGIDFGVPEGTPVRVSKSGTVIKRRELTTSYGKYLFIDHGGGLVTIYAHNSELLVNEGDTVKAGQIIAKSGNTGNSTGPHCHWELRVNGVAQNVAPSLKIGDHV